MKQSLNAQPVDSKPGQRLRTLYAINTMLAQIQVDGIRLEAILPRVLSIIVKELDAQDGSILLVDRQFNLRQAWLTDEVSKSFLSEVVSKGIAGWVIANKEAALIQDTRQDDRWLRRQGHSTSAEGWSAMCIPFVIRNLSIGAITIHKKGTNQFSAEDLSLLNIVANQTASAVENARLYHKTQRQLKVAAFLNKASQAINSSLDLNQIMQSLLGQMNRLLYAEALSIALVDKATKELVFQVAEGMGSEKIVGLHLPADEGVSGWVMTHAQAALVNDMMSDPRFHRQADDRTGHPTKAMICAPIQFQDGILGTIQAINPLRGSFSDDDLNLLVHLANIASSAIANAQQHAQTLAAETRYTSLFQDSVDPIVLTDINGRIVEANQRAIDFWEYPRPDLMQMEVSSLHTLPDGFRDTRQVVETADNFQIAAETKNGHAIHLQVYVKRVSFNNNDWLQWIYHDITKQVELEETRQDLIAMLFHDLQSPLGNVLTSLELMESEIPDDNPDLTLMVDVANRSARKLQILVRSLLDINKLESGQLTISPTQVNVVELIGTVAEILQSDFSSRGIELVRETEEDLPTLHIEEDLMERVLVNLLNNALKYGRGGKEVRIKAQRHPEQQHMVLMSVSDQGPGIPVEFRDAVFDKFRRLKNSNNRSKGLGLGLAFCRLAVEAHHGRIWVDEAPGGGARFNFTIPITPIMEEDTATA